MVYILKQPPTLHVGINRHKEIPFHIGIKKSNLAKSVLKQYILAFGL